MVLVVPVFLLPSVVIFQILLELPVNGVPEMIEFDS